MLLRDKQGKIEISKTIKLTILVMIADRFIAFGGVAMLAHRFRDQLDSWVGATAPVNQTAVAFVPCPMFQMLASCQQAQIQEIYRIAAERTREQLRPIRSYLPQFSVN